MHCLALLCCLLLLDNSCSQPFAKTVKTRHNTHTLEKYVSFAKDLFLTTSEFKYHPEQLKCTDVDPEKQFIWSFPANDEGIRICDICPNLSPNKLVNIFIAIEPILKFKSLVSDSRYHVAECFDRCLTLHQCVALSFDHESRLCYLFNSTDGGFRSQNRKTSVVLDQPMEGVGDWVYSRHSKLSPMGAVNISTQPSFLDCIYSCETYDKENETPRCLSVSYNFVNTECLLYTQLDHIDFTYEYGIVTAFHVEKVYQNDPSDSWRFMTSDKNRNNGSGQMKQGGKVRNDNGCLKPPRAEFGNFFQRKCLLTNTLGCDQVRIGCQRCYYPEVIGYNEHNLQVCQNSIFNYRAVQTNVLDSCFKDCMRSSDCIAVDFNVDMNCVLISANSWIPPSTEMTRYDLLFTGNKHYLNKFSLIPQSTLVAINGFPDRGLISTRQEVSLKNCLSFCLQNIDCQKVLFSFENQDCTLAYHSIGFNSNISRVGINKPASITFLRKPALNSHLFRFHRTPGWELTSPNFTHKIAIPCYEARCSVYIIPRCLRYCLNNLTLTCQYVSVQYMRQTRTGEIECTFYGPTFHSSPKVNNMKKSFTSEIFTRVLAELTLNNLNAIPFFQENDLKGCFNINSKQTQTTLSNNTNSLFDARRRIVMNTHRRTKRFFGFIFNALKKFATTVVSTVVDVVKSTVRTVIDTGKGLVKGLQEVARGNFHGALKAISNIPVVQAVSEIGQNVIKVGKGIIKGDVKAIGSAVLNIATSKVLDVVPVGRITGNVLRKIAGSTIKRAKRHFGKYKYQFKKNLRKKRRTKHQKKCRKPRSTKMTPSTGCSTSNPKCKQPIIKYANINKCHNQHVSKVCEYNCKIGYKKQSSKDSICTRDPLNTNKAQYIPTPACKLMDCDTRPKPVISLTVDMGGKGKRNVYVVKYDKSEKLPIWSVAYHDSVNKNHVVKRASSFYSYPCPQLRNRQPTLSNYKGSGWDKGHLTPSEPMRFTSDASKLANLYINVAPQDPKTNREPWRILESVVSKEMSSQTGFVATGVCENQLKKKTRTIFFGLAIPECFWKMLCYKDKNTVHVVGFIANNTKVRSMKQLVIRTKQTFTPVSQSDIISIAQLRGNEPWVKEVKPPLTARYLKYCSSQLTLDRAQENKWKGKLSPTSKMLGRKKRQAIKPYSISSLTVESEAVNLDRTLPSSSLRNHPIYVKAASTETHFVNKERNTLNEVDFSEILSCGKRVIGYYPSWGDQIFFTQQAQRLTHVIYAFLEMRDDGYIVVSSSYKDDGVKASLNNIEQLRNTAAQFPHLKVMFAVGGWKNSQFFSNVAMDPGKRMHFIASILKIIDTFGFDGIDIHWLYPSTGGAQEGNLDDKHNYVILIKELRQILDQFQKEQGRNDPYLISFAGAVEPWILDPGYDLPRLLDYADWVNVMSNDYFGAWGSRWGSYVGPPSPLYFNMPPRFYGKTNVDSTMNYYVCRTKHPHQISMGVPFYGRLWKNVNGFVDPKFTMWRKARAVSGTFEGEYVDWKVINDKYLQNTSFEKHFHNGSKTPYAWNPSENIFLGFENHKSLKIKIDYAVEKNLGGLTAWAITQDDDQFSMLDILANADLCQKTNPKHIVYNCSPIIEKRWWIWDDKKKNARMCGRVSPLYNGYYPVCDPGDPGHKCCSKAGYCGSGPEYCSCPACKDYGVNPELITAEPIKPTQRVQWYMNDAPDGKRGRCGRNVPKINNEYAICNPDDENTHCCSKGGYCGNSPAHCSCDGCIDFKQRPTYRFPPRRWWSASDGANNAGKCGPSAPRINGRLAICDPASTRDYCCSSRGYCGSSAAHCNCDGCVDFRNNPDSIKHETLQEASEIEEI